MSAFESAGEPGRIPNSVLNGTRNVYKAFRRPPYEISKVPPNSQLDAIGDTQSTLSFPRRWMATDEDHGLLKRALDIERGYCLQKLSETVEALNPPENLQVSVKYSDGLS